MPSFLLLISCPSAHLPLLSKEAFMKIRYLKPPRVMCVRRVYTVKLSCGKISHKEIGRC